MSKANSVGQGIQSRYRVRFPFPLDAFFSYLGRLNYATSTERRVPPSGNGRLSGVRAAQSEFGQCSSPCPETEEAPAEPDHFVGIAQTASRKVSISSQVGRTASILMRPWDRSLFVRCERLLHRALLQACGVRSVSWVCLLMFGPTGRNAETLPPLLSVRFP